MNQVTEQEIFRLRGDTAPFTVTITDGSVPIDISGYSFRLACDPEPAPTDNTNNVWLLTSGIEITLSDPTNGVITVALTGPQADMTPGIYYYDLEWVDGGSFIRTIMRGTWEVAQDITK